MKMKSSKGKGQKPNVLSLLDPGEVFYIPSENDSRKKAVEHGKVYMVIAGVLYGLAINAVNIKNGKLFNFSKDTEITKVKAKVEISG